MGNEAIAAGALAAGVRVVSGYPGTPSTEVLETIAKRNPGFVHVEWSVNEKAALEVAAGAAYSGARALVTMKQVGLNVASDPLMSLNYVGVKGGMVVFVADDPGPISSQTEQDTRHFGKFAKIPVFDPSSPEDAYEMIQDAFNWSERCGMPVIFRATTRVCHACASVDIEIPGEGRPVSGFVKSSDFVIFPKLSYENKKKLEAREVLLSDSFSNYKYNAISGNGSVGIACGGVSAAYTAEALEDLEDSFRVFRVATPFPFPEKKAEEFLQGLERVIVFEELDPVIEDALIYLCGKKHINVEILGKRTGTVPNAGELSAVTVRNILAEVCGTAPWPGAEAPDSLPELPVRPPVLCAGCPHRASFYAVKKAMEGKRAVFCGDIGCYTLGAQPPLCAIDSVLCMGASVSGLHGFNKAGGGEVEGKTVAVIGDSTFIHSGVTGLINIAYNATNSTVIILDNSITGMTGHQQNPTTGFNLRGDPAAKVDVEALCRAVGINRVRVVDPYALDECERAVKEELAADEPSVIISRRPCVLLKTVRTGAPLSVNADKCRACRRCMKLGCPALSLHGGRAVIDDTLCTGCRVCEQLCAFDAIQ